METVIAFLSQLEFLLWILLAVMAFVLLALGTNHLHLEFGGFRIHFDRRYGTGKRTGWSIARDYCWVVEFEPHLLVALWKAFRKYPEPFQ